MMFTQTPSYKFCRDTTHSFCIPSFVPCICPLRFVMLHAVSHVSDSFLNESEGVLTAKNCKMTS